MTGSAKPCCHARGIPAEATGLRRVLQMARRHKAGGSRQRFTSSALKSRLRSPGAVVASSVAARALTMLPTSCRFFSIFSIVALFVSGLPGASQRAWATDIRVNSDASLRAALDPNTGAQNGDRIIFTGNITLSGDLPIVQKSITFAGNSNTLSGDNKYRGLLVYSGTVRIDDLTIQNTRAQGGNGGNGSGAGGGGAGLGGAIFVASAGNATINNVRLIDNAAVGGNGGGPGQSTGPSGVGNAPAAGGGGGMGGNGAKQRFVGYPTERSSADDFGRRRPRGSRR
jgi:hypothetical protein